MRNLKRLPVFLLSFLSFIFVDAQDYFPFPTDTAKWNVYSRLSPWGYEYEDTFIYFLNGDTTFTSDSIALKYSRVYYYRPYLSGVIDTNNSYYLGGLREDANKNIYFKPVSPNQSYSYNCYYEGDDTDEYLLYSFDLQIGDSVFVADRYRPLVVQSVDSILVASEYRKKYYLSSNSHQDFWVEGIGSIWSLFGPSCFIFEGQEDLLCYEDQNIFWQGPFSPFNRCTHFVPVSIQENPSMFFEIYPNPASEALYVVAMEGYKIDYLIIYDMLGQLVKVSPGIKSAIDISSLQTGNYIVEIVSGDYKIRKKLLIE